jgi:hypothetical protein
MDSLLISTQRSIGITIPVSIIFWLFTASFVVHILEEAILGENFVDKVKRLYWKGFDWTKFFWYNTALIILNITAILIYDGIGGAWIIFPLILISERFCNGLYHVFESIKYKTYSSGLLTSVFFWILVYFLVKYAVVKGEISVLYIIIALSTGIIITFASVFALYISGKHNRE